MKRIIFATVIAAAALTAPAFAATENFRMDVAYTAQNLTTRTSAETEYDHIRSQVVDRCKADNARLHIAGSYAENYCVRTTMDRAVRTIGSPLLKEVHLERR